MSSTILGYPRIGPHRELKRASEAHWAGETSLAELEAVAASLRRDTWRTLRDAGLTAIPSNTFSRYDHVLDTAVLFDAIPSRFAEVAADERGREAEAARYFAMARGTADAAPLELTKWFDTNYHYLVPELGPDTRLRPAGTKPLDEYLEARELGIETRPVLVGPLTFLALSKPAADAPAGWRPMRLLDDLVAAYAELLERLAQAGAQWVQLDEPILATDIGQAALAELERAYARLGAAHRRPRLLVTCYFGSADAALPVLAAGPVEAIGLDLVAAPEDAELVAAHGGLGEKALVAGVVDGRNVWRADLDATLARLTPLLDRAGEVTVATSCSLLHVPLDLDAETEMDERLRRRLAFARQKVDEVVLLGRALTGDGAARAEVERRDTAAETPASFTDRRVRERVAELEGESGRGDIELRQRRQREVSSLPPLPTTTIGSFPQTAEVRSARADYRAGRLDRAEYERRMRAEIDRVIALQEEIGLDLLVHGEPERNDMVQYFAEQLDGYAGTQHGWVQSYGSRYVRPPILYGDVSRPGPMTVDWIGYAQSRTDKPVKGMLTGPVTMLAWSFVREDQPLSRTALQVALALREEIADLERAGIGYIQVDEAALRELMPLRRERHEEYLAWAVAAFRLATSGAADTTQVHTHMCYSEFGPILGALDALDADVTSIEAARSGMEPVGDLARGGYRRGIGPGVYDIHSPRVPPVAEIESALRTALDSLEPDRLWVNPDCGLKTRDYAEVEPSLRNMVRAARDVRTTLDP